MMDITFLLLRWLVIFTGYFLLGLSIGALISFVWISWRERKANKEFMRKVLSKRK
jgi:hypothetical protein